MKYRDTRWSMSNIARRWLHPTHMEICRVQLTEDDVRACIKNYITWRDCQSLATWTRGWCKRLRWALCWRYIEHVLYNFYSSFVVFPLLRLNQACQICLSVSQHHCHWRRKQKWAENKSKSKTFKKKIIAPEPNHQKFPKLKSKQIKLKSGFILFNIPPDGKRSSKETLCSSWHQSVRTGTMRLPPETTCPISPPSLCWHSPSFTHTNTLQLVRRRRKM